MKILLAVMKSQEQRFSVIIWVWTILSNIGLFLCNCWWILPDLQRFQEWVFLSLYNPDGLVWFCIANPVAVPRPGLLQLLAQTRLWPGVQEKPSDPGWPGWEWAGENPKHMDRANWPAFTLPRRSPPGFGPSVNFITYFAMSLSCCSMLGLYTTG